MAYNRGRFLGMSRFRIRRLTWLKRGDGFGHDLYLEQPCAKVALPLLPGQIVYVDPGQGLRHVIREVGEGIIRIDGIDGGPWRWVTGPIDDSRPIKYLLRPIWEAGPLLMCEHNLHPYHPEAAGYYAG